MKSSSSSSSLTSSLFRYSASGSTPDELVDNMSRRLMEKIWVEGVGATATGANSDEIPVKPKFIQFLSKLGIQA